MRPRFFPFGMLAGWLFGIAAAQTNPFIGLGSFTGANAGQSALPFLRLPVGARALALGGHELTTGQEAVALCGFPAALGSVRDWRYSLSHAEVLGEFRHEDFSLAWPLPAFGTLGLNSTGLFSGPLEDARDVDENPVQTSPYDFLIGLGYGQSFAGDLFSLGARVDYFHSSIAEATANGTSLSASARIKFLDDYQAALALDHFSYGIRYNVPGAPLEPIPFSWTAEVGRPLAYHRLSWQAGFTQDNDGIGKYYAGAEWKTWNVLLLRGGYEGSLQDRSLSAWSGISAGFGFSWEAMTVDYGFKAMLPLGFTHALTLHYSRKPKNDHPDQGLLQRSQDKYRAGRYASALKLCREAVSVNPYNYQALAFCQQIEKEMTRLSEEAVSVLYTANTLGELVPVWTNGQAFGGLARRQSKLLELTRFYPQSVVVDAGGMLAPNSDPDRQKTVYAAYARMPYQAIFQGPEAEKDPDLKPVTVDIGRGFRAVIYGYATGSEKGDPQSFAQSFQEDLRSGSGVVLRILLFHGTLAAAQALAKLAPEFDAILLSGETIPLWQPLQVGKTLIACPGSRGTHLGQITFLINKDGWRTRWTHRLIPLDDKVLEDPDMQKLLAPAVQDLNADLGDAGMDDERATVFAAVEKRRNLVLFDLEKQRQFPVGVQGLSVASPVLGYGKNRVAFAGTDSTGHGEFYAVVPGKPGLDTLTHFGGVPLRIRYILKSQSLLATYRKPGPEGSGTHLYRIDPWDHAVRDLSEDRFGDVISFGVTAVQNRLALVGRRSGKDSLWVGGLDLAAPIPIAAAPGFAGSPTWSADGKRLAFLQAEKPDDTEGVLRVFDFDAREMLKMPLTLRAREAIFTADGNGVILSSGVNVFDLQELRLDSMSVRHITSTGPDLPSGEHPRLKRWGQREGVLYEGVREGRRAIHFLDFKGARDTTLLEGETDYSLDP